MVGNAAKFTKWYLADSLTPEPSSKWQRLDATLQGFVIPEDDLQVPPFPSLLSLPALSQDAPHIPHVRHSDDPSCKHRTPVGGLHLIFSIKLPRLDRQSNLVQCYITIGCAHGSASTHASCEFTQCVIASYIYKL